MKVIKDGKDCKELHDNIDKICAWSLKMGTKIQQEMPCAGNQKSKDIFIVQ